MHIKVFTTKSCPYCQKLREFLENNHLAYEELDVANSENLDEMIKISEGHQGLPFMVISDDEGGVAKIEGCDEGMLTKLFKDLSC